MQPVHLGPDTRDASVLVDRNNVPAGPTGHVFQFAVLVLAVCSPVLTRRYKAARLCMINASERG